MEPDTLEEYWWPGDEWIVVEFGDDDILTKAAEFGAARWIFSDGCGTVRGLLSGDWAKMQNIDMGAGDG